MSEIRTTLGAIVRVFAAPLYLGKGVMLRLSMLDDDRSAEVYLTEAERDAVGRALGLFTREQVGEYQAREARLVSEPLRRRIEDLETERDKWEKSAGVWETEAADLLQDRNRADARVLRLKAQVEELQRQLAETTGQMEAAKQATREIVAERNTWARQLADMRDERNAARDEAERQRGLASEMSVDRDNLCVEIERVIEEWERSAARPIDNPMLNWQARHAAQLRRALARWLTT